MKRFRVLTSKGGKPVGMLTILLSTLLVSYGVAAHTLPISELILVADEGYLHLASASARWMV